MPRPLVKLFCLALLLAATACVEGAPLPGPKHRLSTTPPGSAQGGSVQGGPAQGGSAQTDYSQPGAALPGAATGAEAVQMAKDMRELATNLPTNIPTVRVGLLLPLTGESQALGQSMMDAATLALYDAYIPLKPEQIRAKIVLIPKDTGSAPSAAALAAEQTIQQGASLILGPLFSNSVSAVAPVARKAGVPVLSFSNNKTVAGENVYVFGFMPEQQIVRVSEYAALKQLASFGAMLPNDTYGTTVKDHLKSRLTAKGLRVEPVEMYSRTQANLDAAARRLKNGYDKAPFEALFIADGGAQLKQTLAAIQAHGINHTNVRYIGTGLWDDDEVRRNPDMQGAWFASSPTQYYTAFERRFTAAYGYKPQRLASLAYDAVTLAAALANAGNGPNFSAQVMTGRQGFTGPANGLYRLNADGTSERSLSVMEINGGNFKTLEAAQKQF